MCELMPNLHICVSTTLMRESLIRSRPQSSFQELAPQGCSWIKRLPILSCCRYNAMQNSICCVACCLASSNAFNHSGSSRCIYLLSSCKLLNQVHGGEPMTTKGTDVITSFQARFRSAARLESQPFVLRARRLAIVRTWPQAY